MKFVSYAQNQEDVMLWRALGHVPHGFYVDVGAMDPDADSVTRALYDRGWSGITIEPVPAYARRLRAARPRDVTLETLVGEADGEADFFIVSGSGLSTTDAALARGYAATGRDVRGTRAPVRTLAGIVRAHAGEAIHVLKIDAEGAERAVLAGADFSAHRPWVVLVEATAPMSTALTHAAWEPLLLRSDYRFVWFDGLNRFYVAAEHVAALGHHFLTPPNVFDDFVRASDSALAPRVAEAEGRASAFAARADAAETALSDARAANADARITAETHARVAELREWEIERLRHEHSKYYEASEAAQKHLHATVAHYAATVANLDAALAQATGAHARAALADAMLASTSWRITAPMRLAIGKLRPASIPDVVAAQAAVMVPATPDPGFPKPTVATPPVTVSRPMARAPGHPIRTVHQFHSSSATGDAITNALFLTRRILRGLGYRSDIFVQHVDPALAHELRPMDALPAHADYVLIVHFSMGFGELDFILNLPARKVLSYHNITPHTLFAGKPALAHHARLGRAQLPLMRPHMAAALAHSEYNANELRALGFDPVQACPLLFDVDAIRRPAAAARREDAPFTILFVGRVGESKGQAELITAYARFRTRYPHPSRLVLIGHARGASDATMETIHAAIAADGLAPHVTLTGALPDDALHAWFAAADLYVSLSLHEGFGVPLIEAMAYGVPVLAYAAGAVAETLDDDAALLHSRDPDAAAARMASLAKDPDARAKMAARQSGSLARFRLPRQIPTLVSALTFAGAAPPEPPGLRDALAARARVTLAGDIFGQYSLAAVNRRIARTLQDARPGAVRVIPIYGAPPADETLVPAAEAAFIRDLAARPPFATGPAFIVSQHYPVWTPDVPCDAALALFFWEESLIPLATVAALNAGFRAVLAPTAFVAKALVDSGVSIPVRVIGYAPDLAAFAPLAARRPLRRETFTFLHVSSCFPRKGLDVLLRAYGRAFRADDPVRLIIKTFPNPNNDAAAQLARLAATTHAAPVVLIEEDLDQAALLDLYAQADAMVLPTRGEGFNLPAAEAMAAGLPLIVTALGGHADFCTSANSRLLACVYAASASHLASPHSVWIEPDEDDLVAAMREAVEDRGTAAERAGRAAVGIAAAAEPAAFAQRMLSACVDALVAPPPPALRLVCVSSWDVRCGVAEYARALVGRLAVMDGIGVTVIADTRTPADATAAVPVRSAWLHGDPRGMANLLTAIAQADPHVLLFQHQPGLMNWGTLAALLGAPVMEGRRIVVTLHNTEDLAAHAGQSQGAIRALSGVARVIVHTVAAMNGLRALGVAGNVTLFPQGAPAPRDPPPPPARGLPRDAAPLIGSYGFFLPGKGVAQLIAALPPLRARWPGARLRLVNAAYDHPASAAEILRARTLADTLGVADAIQWETDFLPHERSLDLLTACDLVVLPYQSSNEGSSAAVRTALASGAPVAVTSLPLFDETGDATLRLGGTGPDNIADGIIRIFDDHDARLAAQTAARAWLAARDWDAIATRMHGLLLGLRASPEC